MSLYLLENEWGAGKAIKIVPLNDLCNVAVVIVG